MEREVNFPTAHSPKISVQFQTTESYAHFCMLLCRDGIPFIPAPHRTIFLFQDITELHGHSKKFISTLQTEKQGNEKITVLKSTGITKREIPTPEQVDQLLDEFIARRKASLCQPQIENPYASLYDENDVREEYEERRDFFMNELGKSPEKAVEMARVLTDSWKKNVLGIE